MHIILFCVLGEWGLKGYMVERGGGVKRSEWDGRVKRWGVVNMKKGLSSGERGRRPSWDWFGCINSCT